MDQGKEVFSNSLEVIYFGYLMDTAATVRDEGVRKTKVKFMHISSKSRNFSKLSG